MKLGTIMAAYETGTVQRLETLEGLDGAMRYKLRKFIKAMEDETKAYDAVRIALVKEVAGESAEGIDIDHPRYAYVLAELNKVREQEVELVAPQLFSTKRLASLPLSIAHETWIEKLGLVIPDIEPAKEDAAPEGKPVPTRGKRR